jgi:hypothetical protein
MSKVKEGNGSSRDVALPLSYGKGSSQPVLENDNPPSEYSIFLQDTVIYRAEYISLVLGPQYEEKSDCPTKVQSPKYGFTMGPMIHIQW